MTLPTFLNLTAAVPEPTLRRSLALALSVERPTSPEGYARFYERVLAGLCTIPRSDGDPASQQVVASVHA